MNVTFRPRLDRGADGLNPIYCRITVKSKRVNFSTNLVSKWDKVKKKAVGKNATVVNQELARIKADLTEIWRDMDRSGTAYTSKMIYAAYTKTAKAPVSWLDTFDSFGFLVELKIKSKELKDTSFVEWGKHRAHLVHFLEFLKRKDCYLDEIERSWYQIAKSYFLTRKNQKGEQLKWNYVRRIMGYLHRTVKWGFDEGNLDRDPWSGLTMAKRKPTLEDFMYLTHAEVQKLVAYQPVNNSMKKTKDIALFMMYSGLSYKDYYELSDELVKESDGDWLIGERGKTGTAFFVPVWKFPVLGELIAKYDRDFKKLPRLSNGRYNVYIKALLAEAEIGDKSGVFTTHDCRRTFAMMCWEHYGLDDKKVAEMLGHKNTQVTHEHYLMLTLGRVRNGLSGI